MPYMTMPEQSAFVHDLIDNVRAELMRDIAAEKLPEHWNGIELRRLVADRFARACMGAEGDKQRWKAYRNELIVRNL